MTPAQSTQWANYCESYWALLRGEMPGGWDLHEHRWTAELSKPAFLQPQHEWRGEDFQRRSLLLYYEQGAGDMFQFIRFASMVKPRGGQVLLACTADQADVLGTCPGIDEVWPVVHGRPGPTPGFDLHLPVCSLPRIFRTDLATIPSSCPYLSVPPFVRTRELLVSLTARVDGYRRVGLMWAGSPTHPNDKNRSIPPGALDALASIPGCAWFGFQLEPKATPNLPGLVNLGAALITWSETAFALSQMDLLITADTGIAHLAGAMGVPVWVLLPYFPDFRWLLDRSDSPWYPTMRIFRQPKPGDWPSVLAEVVAALGSLSRGAA
ncbi:MAG: hypothetical protein HY014_05400 [Acidobacteria bacterium]|nr:hypothetical protein [Acidobacteriota bacterium]MBI3487588.1 hypothetical protein [Acidobacteriota bacterium]